MPELTLLTLPPSPHNTKIRLALKLKQLDFEAVPVDFQDRSAVLERSGQPLTPVLLDGNRVIYDSFGILRYLDANWPEPRLFAATREGQREIQEWERFAVLEVGPALSLLLGQLLSDNDDPAATSRAQGILDSIYPRLEQALGGAPYLGGDRPNAADLTVVPFLRFASARPEQFPEGDPGRFVAERCSIGPEFAATAAWIERVMAIDQPATVG